MTSDVSHKWKSQWFFVLASVGAAAGLGNLWRFPYMVYENGGAAFMLAYIVCLFVLVIPMMMAEVALGQHARKDFVALLGEHAGWFGRFFGWMIVLIIAAVIGYYACITGWGVNFMYHSFFVAWSENAQDFFFNDVLQLTDNPSTFGSFSLPIILGCIVSYLFAYFSIFKGLDSISKVVKWTVSLPFFLLFILLINAMFLPGSFDGFTYLLVPDWSKFFTVEVWKQAASQSFLSANIGIIITLFYASFTSKKTSIARSSLCIALGNASISFLAAFAIFGTLGYTAMQQGVDITDVAASGPTLAFVAFPAALATLPFGSALFSVLFFLTVFTLAIDSLFALIEVVASSFRSEFTELQYFSREVYLGIVFLVFFFYSLVFTGGNGLYRLDALDHALWSHIFYWALIPEIVIIGWCIKAETLRTVINKNSPLQIGKWFNFVLQYLAPAFLLFLYLSSLPEEFAKPYEGYANNFLWAWMYIPMIVIVAVSALLATRKQGTGVLHD